RARTGGQQPVVRDAGCPSVALVSLHRLRSAPRRRRRRRPRALYSRRPRLGRLRLARPRGGTAELRLRVGVRDDDRPGCAARSATAIAPRCPARPGGAQTADADRARGRLADEALAGIARLTAALAATDGPATLCFLCRAAAGGVDALP